MNNAASAVQNTPSAEVSHLPCILSANLQTVTELLETSSVQSRVDLGGAVVYKVRHPNKGLLVLVNTTGDSNAVIQC